MKEFFGLTSEQVLENRSLGSNRLTQKQRATFWQMYVESLKDIWLIILFGGLIIKVAINIISYFSPSINSDGWFEPISLFCTIMVISIVSTAVSYKQERGVDALQREASGILVKVYRDGELAEISIDDVVIGDYVFLQPGDKIPADGILIDGSLKVDQSVLNGESREAKKTVLGDNPMPGNGDYYTEFKCFRGCVVTSGQAVMKVTDVGDKTEIGIIGGALNKKVEILTPSEEKLQRLAKNIGRFGYCGGIIAGIIYFISGFVEISNHSFVNILNLFLSSGFLGVSIVIMAVPEGLPLMNTLVEGLNVGKMLKAHIYVRNPKAIETAGYVTHLFTDKTGTLTYGKMKVSNIITGDGVVYENFNTISEKIRTDIIIGAGINNASEISSEGTAVGSNDTDRALLTFFIENDVIINKGIVESSEPFDSRVKYASVTMSDGTKYFKGAPDIIMADCTSYQDMEGKVAFTQEMKSNLIKALNNQTARAMRVIAVVKECNGEKIFVCLISIRDDVRKDVKKTVKRLRRAGVAVTMVTGDVSTTARAIGKDSGLVTKKTDICLTHNELAELSDDELKEILPRLKVVSRAIPSDKERLVKISQSIGEVVGMTGDGVNDAPALHRADVGFAMGSGTEVAKEAGDIIILNDSLTSIADAIMYGRTMSKSVKKFIIFQLTVNVSTVITAVLGPILGWNEVFTIVQILWINMIMDTLAAIAFGQEPARREYMNEKPIPRSADILNKYLKSEILTGAIFITIICVGILKNFFGIQQSIIGSTDTETVRTFMFATFILAILWNSLNARTESTNLFEHIKENKNFVLVMGAITVAQIFIVQVGGAVFGTVSLSFGNWVAAILISFLIIPIDLVRKVIVKKMGIKE